MAKFHLLDFSIRPDKTGRRSVYFLLADHEDVEQAGETIVATVLLEPDDTLPLAAIQSEALERVQYIVETERQARKQPARPGE